MNCARRWMDDAADCVHAQFGRDANVGSDFVHALDAKLPLIGMRGRAKTLAPIGAGEAQSPPVGMGLFPEQPFFSGLVGEQVLSLESLGYGEALCSFSNQHDVTRMEADCIR